LTAHDLIADAPQFTSPEHGITTDDAVVVLDFGSQYSQLITRRVRECGVYCEMLHHDATWDEVAGLEPKGVILSGGPNSVYAEGAPQLPSWVLDRDLPVLGICYGMQLLAQALGGSVEPGHRKEYGQASITVERSTGDATLFEDTPNQINVWMSHGDHVSTPPDGFHIIATSPNSPVAAMERGHVIGIQFHPEVNHTEYGTDILRNFLTRIAGCTPTWSSESFIDAAVQQIRDQVGVQPAIRVRKLRRMSVPYSV